MEPVLAALAGASPLSGRHMKPTKQHRPAVWECMLGTVYARNDRGETRYFDYDWAKARTFAGADEPDRDPRCFRHKTFYRGTDEPRQRQLVMYVLQKYTCSPRDMA